MISTLLGKSVFRDKERLLPRHLPGTLIHREKYLRILSSLFEGFLEHPEETYMKILQLLGPIGSGKTSTAQCFGGMIQRDAQRMNIPLKYIHINCKSEAKTPFILYKTLLEMAAPEIATRGHSPGEMLRLLVDYLRREGKYLLLTLDDVDYLVRRSKAEEPEGGVIYDITRLNEFYLGEYQQIIGVIFIARDASFRGLLDPSERSTLGNVVVRLPGYGYQELQEILEMRVEDAFETGAVSEDIIDYVAVLASGKNPDPGDCRFALDILLMAGLIADGEEKSKVLVDHVRRATAETYPSISLKDIATLSEQELTLLKSAVQALDFEGNPYVAMKSVYDFYSVLCETDGMEILSYNLVRKRLLDLHHKGLIDYNNGLGVSITGVSLKDLTKVLNDLKRG